ncbi:hypothetical protein METBIDRAFT_12284 [Metschnikowia bicuspidata var. bicuspidata NRRL YB-4993]|uniref:Uncharacterized protein n=1 Tax=Metschnikowia bicuspidata var. bicuspidata NRRL YB-4993 TaxID=869754 RepID=A0A1A0H8M4_9ASCO|nr:hypothetical protein METBIDRAFT_12284 [Metschnikowia bicuspidata var. bicuspidata NRRL YB-4993]OBA20237.1 hypothetical protein METBIDRAFT_12284 [Metschnikowia bicuspidata var. bicuspidata NRRL YB-4993]
MGFLFPPVDSQPPRSALDITELLDRLRGPALAAHQAAFSNAKHYYDRRHKHQLFSVGDEVYLDLPQLGNQLDAQNSAVLPELRSKFAGPVAIASVLSPVNCELAMPPDFRDTQFSTLVSSGSNTKFRRNVSLLLTLWFR